MADLKRSNMVCRLAGVSVLLLAPGLVLAGTPDVGSITFSPLSATSVPTLGGTLLVLLAMFLGFIALRAIRDGNGRGSLSSVLIGTLALATLLSATGGVSLLTNANAVNLNAQDVEAGDYPVLLTENTYTSLVDGIVVTALTLPTGCVRQTTSLDCAVNVQLQAGELCIVDCAVASSDRRLKTDIVQIGEAANGLPLYEFRYRGDDAVYRGVMAQDVLQHMPEAVVQGPEGYLAVNYAMLGLEFKRVR